MAERVETEAVVKTTKTAVRAALKALGLDGLRDLESVVITDDEVVVHRRLGSGATETRAIARA